MVISDYYDLSGKVATAETRLLDRLNAGEENCDCFAVKAALLLPWWMAPRVAARINKAVMHTIANTYKSSV